MKRFSGITFLLIFFISCNGNTSHEHKPADSGNVKNFTVLIEEWNWLSKTDYKITNDSIVITHLSGDTIKTVERIRPDNMSEIHKAILEIDLSKLKNEYIAYEGTHDYIEFNFSFDIEGKKKQVAVYLIKVDELYQMVSVINKYLPEQHKINYVDDYFNIAGE